MKWCIDNQIAISKLTVLLSAVIAALFLMAASYFQFKGYQSGVNEVYTDLWLAGFWFILMAVWNLPSKQSKEREQKEVLLGIIKG